MNLKFNMILHIDVLGTFYPLSSYLALSLSHEAQSMTADLKLHEAASLAAEPT